MNKQPFYHRMEVLFTATSDKVGAINTTTFREALERCLKRELGDIVKGSVEFDGPATAMPGDPADLV